MRMDVTRCMQELRPRKGEVCTPALLVYISADAPAVQLSAAAGGEPSASAGAAESAPPSLGGVWLPQTPDSVQGDALTPADLAPFTRHPILLVVDSPAAQSFKVRREREWACVSWVF
jgi:hypothetical protein